MTLLTGLYEILQFETLVKHFRKWDILGQQQHFLAEYVDISAHFLYF